MRPIRVAILSVVALVACLIDGRTIAETFSVRVLLDRYAAGQFDAALAGLDGLNSLDPVLDQLRRDGPAWIDEGESVDRSRRRLAAATFALEAARLHAWHEWKWVQEQPQMRIARENGEVETYTPFPRLIWKAPPQLIEWGCALLRTEPAATPIERWWQLGAMAVGHRSEDFEFLVGNPIKTDGRGIPEGAIGNPQDEIEHLNHAMERFPDEPRFVLGGAIALEWRFGDEARPLFESLKDHIDVGPEATLRLGALTFRLGERQRGGLDPLDVFERVETQTRDPYLIFLARFFSGQELERKRRVSDAERAFRGAAAAVPHAQSATMALAALLFRSERRTEAHRLASDMLAARPPPPDPWREYVHADDRFWPLILAKLRTEVAR